jgi:hypothetical protein
MRFLLIPFLLLALTMTDAVAQQFSEGQVWEYSSRPGERGSTLLINKAESDAKLGVVFHISVRGVKVKNRNAPLGVCTDLPHFPVSAKTLQSSVTRLLRTESPNPGYVEGYETWRKAFEKGDAGVFTIPVAEIVELVEKTINQ